MVRIAIPFSSGAGHTACLAKSIADAIAKAGCTVSLINLANLPASGWTPLHDADAIVFGTPTFMGNVTGEFKTFMDQSSDFWLDQPWKDKIAAGFTVGSSPSGDKANTLATLSIFAAQHGMIWVGQGEIGPPANPQNSGINTQGFWLGLGATASRDKSQLIDANDLETARRFGVRIATATQRWNARNSPALN